MSPEIEQGYHAEIDRKAECEKAKVSFDINLLEQDEEHYRRILFSGVEVTDYELYKEFVAKLDHVEEEALRITGVIIHRMTPQQVFKSDNPYVRLGWMQYGQPMLKEGETLDQNKEYTYFMFPTERGVSIIDARRESTGLPSVETTRKIANKHWDAVWARA
jgi:hypothetical protein